eukprot:15102044-Alexandrium_andersonii.AAC.1
MPDRDVKSCSFGSFSMSKLAAFHPRSAMALDTLWTPLNRRGRGHRETSMSMSGPRTACTQNRHNKR